MRNASTRLFFALAVLVASYAQAGDTVYYYHNDAQGNPVVVTDAHGNVVERTYYGPYGEVLNRPLRDGPGYTGHEEDAATGMVYMQQRYYVPQIKRFPTVDPVDVDPNTGANFNRYWYANDNPYRYTDPDGRQEVPESEADNEELQQALAPKLVPMSPAEISQIGQQPGLPTGPDALGEIQSRGNAAAGKIEQEVKAIQLKANQAQGKAGEAATRAKLGDKVAGEQVTFKTSDGTRARPDFVTKDNSIVESKTGGAGLSPGQAKLKADVDAGRQVTPVGQNAAKAGLQPGEPTTMKSCTIDRC